MNYSIQLYSLPESQVLEELAVEDCCDVVLIPTVVCSGVVIAGDVRDADVVTCCCDVVVDVVIFVDGTGEVT